ncbi:MAG: protein phosphatase 2C domain-containing protein [Deltaproteobacteria bacterium]|nr:protein phosphatase 2C domain-containing protein [Deltaproteobacteria bacterium]
MNASKQKALTISAARLGLQLAVASVPGRDHQLAGRPNQDAWGLAVSARHLAAVVSDGCGSAPHSELGARLAAQWTAEAIVHELECAGPLEPQPPDAIRGPPSLPVEAFERARLAVLDKLAGLHALLSSAPVQEGRDGAAREAVHDHLLFTLVGVAVGPHSLRTFSIGDGVIVTDGHVRELGPFEGNRPPYLGYALLPDAAHGLTQAQLRWQLDPQRARADFTSLSLATDGALARRADAPEPVLRLAPLFMELHRGEHFRNPDALRRALWLEARDTQRSPGRLPDDTTILSLRAVTAAPHTLSA